MKNEINLEPDIKVKDLAYGDELYSTSKLSTMLSSINDHTVQEIDITLRKIQTTLLLTNSALYILWSQLRLNDMFDIQNSAIINGKVSIEKIAFLCKDTFNHTNDNFMLKLEIYENSSVVEDYKKAATFGDLEPVATSTNSVLHRQNATLEFNFEDCKLDPTKLYICRWVSDLKIHLTDTKYSWLYGNFKLTTVEGYKYAHGVYNTDIGIVSILSNDYLYNNLTPIIPYIIVNSVSLDALDNAKKYSMVFNNLIITDDTNTNYYKLTISNGQLACTKL